MAGRAEGEDRMADQGRLNRRMVLKSLAFAGLAAPMVPRLAGAQAKKAIPVNAVSLSANTNKVFDELLASQGFLEEFGAAPKTTAVSDGAKVIAALVSGSGDVCMQLGFVSVIPAIQAGARIKVIAGSGILPELAVYSARPDIRSAKDLIGRTVAVGPLGAQLHMLMVSLLRKKGLDYTKVDFVNIGSSTDAFRAMAAGKVDAAPGDNAFYANPGKFGAHALTDGALWDEIPDYVNQVSIATDAAIEQRSDGIVAMLAAYRRLYQFLHSPKSQEAWLRAFRKALNTTGEEEAMAQWNHYQKHKPFAENLVIAEDKVRTMQDLNMLLGTQKALLDYKQIVNTSLAERAVKLAG
jgi:ABC-type nitrate/sulfonate/bicarbonate transport system substrate-binding protein